MLSRNHSCCPQLLEYKQGTFFFLQFFSGDTTQRLRFLRSDRQPGRYSSIFFFFSFLALLSARNRDRCCRAFAHHTLVSNADIEIKAPTEENDIERQNELLKEAISEEPDAILFSPSSFTESNDLLKEAKEKGIRISFNDSYTEEKVQDLTVATDNLEAGEKLGKFAATLLGPDDQIAIVAHVKGVSTAVEREEGFRKGLGDLAKNIVEVVYCDSQYEKSRKLTQELMEKYPNLKMVAGMNEYSSVGAARAVKVAGAKDRIQVVGVDSSQEAVQLMENLTKKG